MLLVFVIFATVVANKITARISPGRPVLTLLFHVFLLVFLLYFVRVLFNNIMFNPDLTSTIFMLTGPIVGATSLYLGPLVKEYTTTLMKQ